MTLYEKQDRLGGAYRLATRSPTKAEVERLCAYFERALPKAGVEVILGAELTAATVGNGGFDAAVVAVGADEAVPGKIPISGGAKRVSAADVMADPAAVGDRVAIWTCSYHCRYTCGARKAPVEGDPTSIHSHYSYACRAGYAAVDVAEYLASRGKLVSIVTERETVVPGMGYTSRGYLLRRFYRANIRVCGNAKVREITDQGLMLEKAGISFLLDADTVIVSVGATPRGGLAETLAGTVGEVYTVGDCDGIGNAMKAIESAYDVAMRIG